MCPRGASKGVVEGAKENDIEVEKNRNYEEIEDKTAADHHCGKKWNITFFTADCIAENFKIKNQFINHIDMMYLPTKNRIRIPSRSVVLTFFRGQPFSERREGQGCTYSV